LACKLKKPDLTLMTAPCQLSPEMTTALKGLGEGTKDSLVGDDKKADNQTI
jgi:hypothetical protein